MYFEFVNILYYRIQYAVAALPKRLVDLRRQSNPQIQISYPNQVLLTFADQVCI